MSAAGLTKSGQVIRFQLDAERLRLDSPAKTLVQTAPREPFRLTQFKLIRWSESAATRTSARAPTLLLAADLAEHLRLLGLPSCF